MTPTSYQVVFASILSSVYLIRIRKNKPGKRKVMCFNKMKWTVFPVVLYEAVKLILILTLPAAPTVQSTESI